MILKKLIWQEAYRPTTVKDVISTYTEQILRAMNDPMRMQNYIFYSKIGGTGKTSMCKAIVKDLQCDTLNLNASDERSIDTIRTKVKNFMTSVSINKNCKKCIIMDEGEKLTKDASDALKNMMEEYSANCFILLTTNNIRKIPQPLQTRFKVLEFTAPGKKEIYEYLENICKKENLEYDESGLNKTIESYYPSLRNMVNALQDLYNQNKGVFEKNIIFHMDEYTDLWLKIKQYNFEYLKNYIINNNIDCLEFNRYIFNRLMKNEDPEINNITLIKILQILARNERDFNLGADLNIIFISSIFDIMKIIKDKQ